MVGLFAAGVFDGREIKIGWLAGHVTALHPLMPFWCEWVLSTYTMLDLKPLSILLFVFVALLLKTLVKAIGKGNIQNAAWNVYISIATKAGHSQFVELSAKRAELVDINKQRKSVSAQDEYARWTKLNRQFDKINGEVAAMTEAISSEKLKFTKAVGVLISLLTAAPVWFSRVWYRKAILFYFPPGVLPHYVEWALALPFVTTGGVGLTIWMMAVNSVLGSIVEVVLFFLLPLVERPVKVEQKKDTTVKSE